MQYEARITINAPVERIWQLYADVNHWAKWDPDTKASALDGPFEAGATGWHQSPTGPRTPLRFVSVVPNESFVVESRSPLSKLQFDHQLVSRGESVEVIHHLAFTGLLAPFWGRVIGRIIYRGMPQTLGALKKTAEQDNRKASRKAAKRKAQRSRKGRG